MLVSRFPKAQKYSEREENPSPDTDTTVPPETGPSAGDITETVKNVKVPALDLSTLLKVKANVTVFAPLGDKHTTALKPTFVPS